MLHHANKLIFLALLGVTVCSALIGGCSKPTDDEEVDKMFQENQKNPAAISPKGGGPTPVPTVAGAK